MRYKKYGRTDMNVSAMCVGTWAIGGAGWGEVHDDLSVGAIQTMLKNGVNFIDTAPIYGAGHAEEVVGKALKGIDRSTYYVATKFGLSLEKRGRRDLSYDSIIRECDASLSRLGLDYLDLYMVHWPDTSNSTPMSETFSAVNHLKDEGKIRYIGVSNFSQEQIIEAEQYADIVSMQPQYSMVNRKAEDLMAWCQARGIGIMTYGSLGSGILTGAIRELPNFDPHDIRMTFYDYFKEPKFSKVMELLKTLDKIAADHNAPVAQVTVNWSTQNPLVSTALMGVRNAQEAQENCDGTLWSLSDEEIATINAAIESTIGK